MVKRLFVLLLSVSLVFFVSACDSSKYSEAISLLDSARNRDDYENIIPLFEDLGDYKDSEEKLKEALETLINNYAFSDWESANKYLGKYKRFVSEAEYVSIYCKELEDFVIGLCSSAQWDEATSLVDKYCDDYNISHLYDYITYEHGITLMEEEKFDEGLSKLSSINTDSTYYVSAQKVITDYNNLKSSPFVQQFLGGWSMKTTAMGLVFQGTLYFELKYDKVICNESCNQDGYVLSSEHYLYYDDFVKDGIKDNKFYCLLNDDGTLSYGGYKYTKR